MYETKCVCDFVALLVLLSQAGIFAGGQKESVETKTVEKETKLVGYLLGAAPTGMPEVMKRLNEKLKKDINATMEINYISWAIFSRSTRSCACSQRGNRLDIHRELAFYFQEAARGAFYELSDDMLSQERAAPL